MIFVSPSTSIVATSPGAAEAPVVVRPAECVGSAELSVSRRVVVWICVCALVCPPVAALVLATGGEVWRAVLAASAALTVALVDQMGQLARPPGETAEIISIALAAAAAAFAPTVCLSLSEREWGENWRAAINLFPAWTAVMLAPALVVCDRASGLDDSRVRAFVSADFLTMFSASATALALAHAIWARLAPRQGRPAQARLQTGASRFAGC